MPSPDRVVARVSLGLKPTFDRIIGWHAKDITGRVNALGADADGVYVSMVGEHFSEIRAYHHDGRYKQTIFPFPADKLGQLKGIHLQAVAGQGPGVPRRGGFGEIAPYQAISAARTTMAIRNGVIHCLAGGGQSVPKQIIRIGTDGSTGGVEAQGPNLSGKYGTMFAPGEMAVSPDGRWVYLTRLIPFGGDFNPYVRWPSGGRYHLPHHSRHAVYRIPYNSKETLNVRDPFLGEGNNTDTDNEHFDNPEGIALDSQGRIYVSDCGNNRVQVFSPEGKCVATIPVNHPRRIAVHHKTGEIYLSTCDFLTTVTDRWLYVNDAGNHRIVRIKLGYHREQTAALKP